VTPSLSQKTVMQVIKTLAALLKILPLSGLPWGEDFLQQLLPPQHLIYNMKDITMTVQKVISWRITVIDSYQANFCTRNKIHDVQIICNEFSSVVDKTVIVIIYKISRACQSNINTTVYVQQNPLEYCYISQLTSNLKLERE